MASPNFLLAKVKFLENLLLKSFDYDFGKATTINIGVNKGISIKDLIFIINKPNKT